MKRQKTKRTGTKKATDEVKAGKETETAKPVDADGPKRDKEPAAGDAKDSSGSMSCITTEGESLEELPAKIEKLEDSLLRAKADFRNLQRRSQNERLEAITFANADLIRSLLGVIDDFERSIAASDAEDSSTLLEGVRLVHENFVGALRGQGLETIEALHKPFDPSVHEAVMQQPSDEHPVGTVIEEVAKGYRLRNRVLRPTKVVVSAAVVAAEVGAADASETETSERD